VVDDEYGEELDVSDIDDANLENSSIKHLKKAIELTSEMLEECLKSVNRGSIKELQKLLIMFRSACIPHATENDYDVEDEAVESKPMNKYTISDAEIYEKVMVSTIDNCYVALKTFLNVNEVNKKSTEDIHKHKNWKKSQRIVLSFFKSILFTIAGISESSKQSEVLEYLLSCLENYIPFLAPLPKLTKGVIKVLLNIWCKATTHFESKEINQNISIRGQAFLRLRQISIILPGVAADECFRSMYLTFAKSC
jgi:hypothetical protein